MKYRLNSQALINEKIQKGYFSLSSTSSSHLSLGAKYVAVII